MMGRRAQTSERFTHVANLMLRGVLVSKPEHVKPAEMRQAVSRTLDALRRDVINDDPALYRALPERIGAACAATGRCRVAVPPFATVRFAGSGASDPEFRHPVSATQMAVPHRRRRLRRLRLGQRGFRDARKGTDSP
jgi:hypothetical protein